MFAKRPLSPAVQPAAKGALSLNAISGLVMRNPMLAVGGAAAVFTLAAATALWAAADPHAGAPSVHIALSAPGAAPPPPGWREALAPDQSGPTPVTTDSLQLYANPPPDADSAPMQGQATISFPGGPADANSGAGGDRPPLPPAPLAGLTAPGPGGSFLPIVAADGRSPAQAYARPFQSNGKPKVALVIGGLGLNAKSTRQAIEQLPAEVTLSFVPYSDGLQAWIDLARSNGHEVLLEAPMEPADYPNNDPGPYTLLTTSKPAETVQRLDWLLSRATGYFGVTNYLGSRFVTSDPSMLRLSDHPGRGRPLGGGSWRPRLSARARLGGHGPQVAVLPPVVLPPADLSLYRPNVGIVLFHQDGRVWYGRRAAAAPPHNWQFPQGGVDDGEDLLAAAGRELREETGVLSTSLLGRTEEWVAYDFPADAAPNKKGWIGQKQIWFALRFEGDENEIDLNSHDFAEFDAWRWGNLTEAPELVVPFKRSAYEHVVRAFSKFS
jgi:8-oxo-dGTP pyrophosphatase MutT (NUDIX family)